MQFWGNEVIIKKIVQSFKAIPQCQDKTLTFTNLSLTPLPGGGPRTIFTYNIQAVDITWYSH